MGTRETVDEGITRYELLVPYRGMGRFAWAFLLIYVWFIIWGALPVKVIFGGLLLANAAALLVRRRQFAEVLHDEVRIQWGYGPALRFARNDIAAIKVSRPKLGILSRLVTKLAQTRWPGSQPFNYNVEIGLARRKWVILLTPIPFLWPSTKIRLPILDAQPFVHEVTNWLRKPNG